MMTIKVKKAFPYNGMQHKAGKVIEVPRKLGNLLITIGKAESYSPPKPKVVPATPPKILPKRGESVRSTARAVINNNNRAMQALSGTKDEEKQDPYINPYITKSNPPKTDDE